jgi:hypothetical protein
MPCRIPEWLFALTTIVNLELHKLHIPENTNRHLSNLFLCAYISCILILSKFYSPTDAQLNFLRNNFKISIKIYIKTAPTYFGVITIMIILTKVTLARSNSALPDDGDYTETCWSRFNVNFNINFKIVFKTIQLCISW